jgi:L-alanine-DL-glutamate epimerase-like enolase superfamily enzyme
MRIRKVESFLLSHPLAEPRKLPYYGGERTILKRDAMLIRIETESGLIGYAPGQASPGAKAIIDEIVSPFLLGRLLADPDALRIQFQSGPGKAHPEAEKVYCSVEIALYDALGKALGVPLSELVSGRVRDRIRLYGSGGMYMPPEQYAEEAAAISRMGFRAYKLRPGLGPEKDVQIVHLIRKAVDPDFDIMVDAHTWWRMGDRDYSPETVAEIAGKLAECRIAWLEEPLPPDDHDAYIRLHELDHVPLASGEHEPSDARYFDLINSGGVDYVQMDIVCQGGIPTFRRLIPAIAAKGLRFAFHSWGTALEVVAAAHLGICWPDSIVEWLEYPCYSTPQFNGMYAFPLASDILKEPLEVDHGDLIVPKGPGLGVTVDESVIERYPWIPGPWSYFKVDSPAATWAVTGDHSQQWEGDSEPTLG